MQTVPGTRDRLIDEACFALGESGLIGLTVGSVAERAGVSTALVHYHFDTKGRLIVAAAERLAVARAERRLGALKQGAGLAALDALWEAVLSSADGAERGYADLVLHARRDPALAGVLAEHRTAERSAIASRLPTLLRELGASAAAGAEETALVLTAVLDGLALALLAGQDVSSVRAAYDAFWLTTISAGPRSRR